MREHIFGAVKDIKLPKTFRIPEVFPVWPQPIIKMSIHAHKASEQSPAAINSSIIERREKFHDISEISVEGDPSKSTLHPDAEAAYDKANTAYIAVAAHFYKFIEINSGVRSTATQYKLYRRFVEYKFFGGVHSSPANQPGSSNHEYGLAIDIIYREDESLLTASLESNGWKKHKNPLEPWHFDASKIDNFSEIQNKISEVKKLHSIKIVDSLFDRLNAEKTIENEIPAYEANSKYLEKRSKDLGQFKIHLTTKHTTSLNLKKTLEKNVDNFREKIKELTVLKKSLTNFRYNYCPNGNKYSLCTHTDNKLKYTNERNKMISQYNEMSTQLKKERVDLVEEKSSLVSFIKDFTAENSRFKYEVGRLQKDIVKFEIITDRLNKLRTLIKGFEDSISDRLQELASKVSKVRDES
jgi:hypothetical protein